LPHFRFHDLRHTCITHGAIAGVPVEVMSAQVGHMSTEMTPYYAHIATGAKHLAVQKIAADNPTLAELLSAVPKREAGTQARKMRGNRQPGAVDASRDDRGVDEAGGAGYQNSLERL
jgi:hypothetical protein